MESQTAADEAEALANERAELESIWKDLVTSVLSNTRLDPKYNGQTFQYFLPYQGEVTSEQVAALQRSNYGRTFKRLVQLRRQLPSARRPELSELADVFKALSDITVSPFRGLLFREQVRRKPISDQLDLLSEATFLSTYSSEKSVLAFEAFLIEEYLNRYIDFGTYDQEIEKLLLQVCIKRAYLEADSKSKSLSEQLAKPLIEFNPLIGVTALVLMKLLSFILPLLLWAAVNVGVLVWAVGHLESHDNNLWVLLGLLWLAISVPGMVIHYGIWEARHWLHRIAVPGWEPYKDSINADLLALNRTVDRHVSPHVNLRLAREQLIRLQATDIKIPVQLVTLIDRAIAQGQHHW